ncbi:lipid A biosynthesis lauroyl acyltransferase [Candidatus Symbiobacter mobilis]|uniref:Lipid A biosynthesis lauroyl acyltransferase n=1 Tax=Candidatus Symbiobacter mobilis CR TaxID=946483 RepID=U5N7K0_9BURK|nr:lipid A biosynthesis lauroyl acyltransferase [Candidatus Symbiobacter mobilis]AGX87337.1 lipid A biosynthesis lauroyl acyltransferase [Candidatus Symbiobacter mobilis CR]
MSNWLTVALMRALAYVPLPWVRSLGWLLGHLLYGVVRERRHIVCVNLRLCFPQRSPAEIHSLARRVFVRFAQAWLDRSWLWHGSPCVVRNRLRLCGEVAALEGDEPTVLFAPHFVGLDAGWTAMTQQLPRSWTTIYTQQSNPGMDRWIQQGRQRFGTVRLFRRADGVRTIVGSLRQGHPLYLLPDMNFGPQESVFVPFYGVSAATVPSLSRFARLAKAQVIPVVSQMTRRGYDIHILPAWTDFPGGDPIADTVQMNERLQGYIDAMPEQYYWVHKRFKNRPVGEPDVYR